MNTASKCWLCTANAHWVITFKYVDVDASPDETEYYCGVHLGSAIIQKDRRANLYQSIVNRLKPDTLSRTDSAATSRPSIAPE